MMILLNIGLTYISQKAVSFKQIACHQIVSIICQSDTENSSIYWKWKGDLILRYRLKEARIRADLSQERLGILAGIDEATASPRMNQYERGTHAPDFSLTCKFAEY